MSLPHLSICMSICLSVCPASRLYFGTDVIEHSWRCSKLYIRRDQNDQTASSIHGHIPYQYPWSSRCNIVNQRRRGNFRPDVLTYLSMSPHTLLSLNTFLILIFQLFSRFPFSIPHPIYSNIKEYQLIKSALQIATDFSSEPEDASDERISRPYLFLSLNKTANKDFRFRYIPILSFLSFYTFSNQ